MLAVVAGLVVAIMIYTLGRSDRSAGNGTHGTPIGPPLTVTGSPTRSSPTSSPKPASRSRSRTSTTPSSSPRTGGVSCPTAVPCALPDDVGGAVRALNAYRTAHGRSPVAGSVTTAAQDCAVHNGDGPSCPSGYFWEPVGRSGTQVIDKIATARTGPAFLLDRAMSAIEVGWVYVPSSKSYECVLISR